MAMIGSHSYLLVIFIQNNRKSLKIAIIVTLSTSAPMDIHLVRVPQDVDVR